MDKKHAKGVFVEQLMAQKYRLERYTEDELIKLYTALNLVQDKIVRGWGKTIKTEYSQTQALAMLEEARKIMADIKPKIEGSIAGTLGKVSEESASVYSDMITFGGAARAAEVALLSAQQMESFWRHTPVGGQLLNEWVTKTFDGPTVERIQREIFAGMFQGEGYGEMVKRLQEGFVISKREADTLVRTYVHTANVHAMEEVYKKNRDVIAGVSWLTAFDKRTCMRCAALSGKLFPLDDHPPCPLHPRCRCVLVPETDIRKLKVQPKVADDWAKGLRDKRPPGLDTVLTPDGIPKTDFKNWILSQPEKDQRAFFGPTRYQMLKDGKIGWGDLVDPDTYRIKTIPELLGQADVRLNAKMGDAEYAAKLASQKYKQEVKELFLHEKMAGQLDAAAIAKAEKSVEQALLAGMQSPDEVTTFTKGMPGSSLFNPVSKPDMLQPEVWEPIFPDGKKSTGAIVFDEKTGKVYLVKPKGEYGGYKHTFPKGQLEAGLTAQKNALKEVWEEAGLDIEILDYLGGYKKTTSMSHYYVARMKGGSPAAFLTNETEAVLLVPQKQLKKYLNMAVDQKIADDFMDAYKKARRAGGGDASAGFQILNAEKKAKAVARAQAVAQAKIEANIIKEVLQQVKDGTLGFEANWDNISTALLNRGVKDAKKAERVATGIVSKAAKIEKQKLKSLKEYALKNSQTLFRDSPSKYDVISYFLDNGVSMAASQRAATELIKEWAEAAAKAAKEAAEAAAKKAAAAAAAAKRVEEEAKKAAKKAGVRKSKTLRGEDFTLYQSQKGSNKGGFYRNNKTGEKYYFKFLDSDTHIDNEILAARLYREAGVNVPQLTDVIMPDGRRGVASKVVEGIFENRDELVKAGSSMNRAAKRTMAIDAWLANWDVVGLGYDNLVVDAAGKVYHIDVGGSLLFRAQGGLKGVAFGNVVGELETFLNSALNPQSASVFRGITRKELIAGVKKIAAIPDERIADLVRAFGPKGREQELIDTLLSRKRDLLAKFPEAAPKAAVKPKPVVSPERTKVHYGKADDAFADDVNRLGVQGKSIPTDAGDIEDQNVLVFVQELANGEKQTVIKLKLRPGEGSATLENTLTTLNSNSKGSLGIKSAETGPIKMTKRSTSDGVCKVVDDDVPLHDMYSDGPRATMKSYPGQQHTVVYNDGARMRYIPNGGDPNLYALHGEIEITVPGVATKEGINNALERLGKLGVDTTPSTALNSEVMYLDKMVYVNKYHVKEELKYGYMRSVVPDQEWEDVVKSTMDKPLKEQIEARAQFLSKRLGVDDVRKMPGYNPDGEYQMGILSEVKDAGQRLQYRFDLTQEMLDKEMKDYYLVHELYSSSMADSLEAILKGNGSMVSTVDKMRYGIPASGKSPAQDTRTGGANYFFTRIADFSDKTKGWIGRLKEGRIIFKRDMLRRTDAISYYGDEFGRTTPGFVQSARVSNIDGFKNNTLNPSNEVIFKDNVTLTCDNLECWAANNQEEADRARAIFKKFLGGDTFPDGRKVDDVVMTASQWLKKMGY